jgi:hypothetical protein
MLPKWPGREPPPPRRRRPARLTLRSIFGGRWRWRDVAELGQEEFMEPTRVVPVGVQLAEPGDWNGQVLYLLTI